MRSEMVKRAFSAAARSAGTGVFEKNGNAVLSPIMEHIIDEDGRLIHKFTVTGVSDVPALQKSICDKIHNTDVVQDEDSDTASRRCKIYVRAPAREVTSWKHTALETVSIGFSVVFMMYWCGMIPELVLSTIAHAVNVSAAWTK
jgi:hypothetical protein